MEPVQHRPWPGPAVMHVDMDAFFAAVEQLDHPELRGRPVIVGGSPEGRGVVSTASYEARVFGVHSAMPAAQAARLCPDAVWVRPHFDRYQEVSHAVRRIMDGVTPHVEPTSIDEAYLDVTPGAHGAHPVDMALLLQSQVDALGVTCSIGLASGKTVAKIASDARKPHGLTVVWPGEEAAFLAPMHVGALPGVGPATAARLKAVGVRTLGDLASLDDDSAVQLLGGYGMDLVTRARGLDTRPVHAGGGRKSISAEHTFAIDIRTREEVDVELALLVERVARRMRKQGLAGRTITVKLRYSDFTTRTVSRTVRTASNLEHVILPVAQYALKEVWTPGAGLRLLGLGISGFDDSATQMTFGEVADEDTPERKTALAEGIDRVKERFGERVLGFGVQGMRRTDDDEGALDGEENGTRSHTHGRSDGDQRLSDGERVD